MTKQLSKRLISSWRIQPTEQLCDVKLRALPKTQTMAAVLVNSIARWHVIYHVSSYMLAEFLLCYSFSI